MTSRLWIKVAPLPLLVLPPHDVGQFRGDLEQSGLEEDVPAHGKKLELDNLYSTFCTSCCSLQALDLCVQLLEMGETALIMSEAKYCYGAQGR